MTKPDPNRWYPEGENSTGEWLTAAAFCVFIIAYIFLSCLFFNA